MNEDFILRKYPRTPHLSGSRLQPGDEDLSQIPFKEILGKHIVVEEKIDGANAAISFSGEGKLLLQSRGHYLTGGYRERHFNLMKQWANVHQKAFYEVLGSRYIMYGEWMYAKHSIFYDALPHYFMEFDIYDRGNGIFLDTPSRRGLTETLPVCSVPVIGEGIYRDQDGILSLIGDSAFITEHHMVHLKEAAASAGVDADRVCRETEPSRMMEGLYIKVEEGGRITARMKFVRASFLQCILESETHWLDRPVIPNRLAGEVSGMFVS